MHSAEKINQFNMMLVGTGGQGQITLLQILAEASLLQGFDFKSSELHGLSQRGGSVEVHIRFGKKIFSPMISAGKADLVLSLEMQETLSAAAFIGKKTRVLANRHIIPVPEAKPLEEKEILRNLKKLGNDIVLISASEICQKELGTNVVAGVYLISLSAFKKMIPIKPNSILKSIKKIIPKKYLELNIKAFQLAKKTV